MFFQKVVKGISGLSDADVEGMINGNGIICNWWRKKGPIYNKEILEVLNHRMVDQQIVQENYEQIKQDIQNFVYSEMKRILNDPALSHCIFQNQ
ncbi:MAG: hypothetical protein C5B59_09925 [Bacteroidetes bacterium]|nr:MAG: hypothetical protein C5B59_09925 [Bacteroidota bacterium]